MSRCLRWRALSRGSCSCPTLRGTLPKCLLVFASPVCYRAAETQVPRCLVAHVRTPGSSDLLDGSVPPRYFTLPARNACSDKGKPGESRGHKATGPRSEERRVGKECRSR